MNKILFLNTICARTATDVYVENFGNDGSLASMIGANLYWLLPLMILAFLANVGVFKISTWQNHLSRKETIRHNHYMEEVSDRNYDETIRRNRVTEEMNERKFSETVQHNRESERVQAHNADMKTYQQAQRLWNDTMRIVHSKYRDSSSETYLVYLTSTLVSMNQMDMDTKVRFISEYAQKPTRPLPNEEDNSHVQAMSSRSKKKRSKKAF